MSKIAIHYKDYRLVIDTDVEMDALSLFTIGVVEAKAQDALGNESWHPFRHPTCPCEIIKANLLAQTLRHFYQSGVVWDRIFLAETPELASDPIPPPPAPTNPSTITEAVQVYVDGSAPTTMTVIGESTDGEPRFKVVRWSDDIAPHAERWGREKDAEAQAMLYNKPDAASLFSPRWSDYESTWEWAVVDTRPETPPPTEPAHEEDIPF